MAGTVKIPGVGPVKKSWAIAGGGVLVVILGYAYYRHAHSASSSSASTGATASAAPAVSSSGLSGGYGAGDPYPPDGTTGNPSDPYSTDPATGMTYGDEGAGSYAGGGYGYYGSGGSTGGYPTATGFTTNAQWSQAAEDYLVNNTGADATTVAAALGKYLTGGTITPSQQTVVNSAIAFTGYPPVSGPQGYPPSMHVSQPSTGGGGGSGSGSGTVAVPHVTGDEWHAAQAAIRAAGLQVRTTRHGNGHTYYVHSQSPAPGTKVKPQSIVNITVSPG